MTKFTTTLLLLIFSLTITSAQEYNTEIENDAQDIQRALDEIELIYGFDSQQLAVIEMIINRRFDAFTINANIDFPSLSHFVSPFTSVDIQANTQEEYFYWINHYNIAGDEYKEQFFHGTSYSYRDALLTHLGINIFTVIRFSPKVKPFEQSNKLYFIITDMDRL